MSNNLTVVFGMKPDFMSDLIPEFIRKHKLECRQGEFEVRVVYADCKYIDTVILGKVITSSAGSIEDNTFIEEVRDFREDARILNAFYHFKIDYLDRLNTLLEKLTSEGAPEEDLTTLKSLRYFVLMTDPKLYSIEL